MESPIVTVAQGQLKGNQRTNLNGEKFYSFLGIPYAKPPLGELRFKAPEPAEPWNGVRDATKDGNICIQRNEMTASVNGSEDCLNLNVFTKKLLSDHSLLKPVMVWIHGGGFVIGSNHTQYYGPEHLMIEDIVLVSINYRLGFLGFLYVDDPSLEVPGNAALKDQRLALKWVQQNIERFGGDPNNVTIFGESAGGYSVHYHLLSPTSKGLFHKAILQSGCLLSPLNRTPMINVSVELAQVVDKNVKTEKEALDVLRKLSVEEFYAKQIEYLEQHNPRGRPAPNVEKSNKTAFLTAPAHQLILTGQFHKVPILLGFTSNEGILFEIAQKHQLFGKLTGTRFDKIETFVPFKEDDPTRDIILNKLNEVYSREENANRKYLIQTDATFIAPAVSVATIHAKASDYPVYLYCMSLDAGLNFWKRYYEMDHLSGVSHCDELGYLFNVAFAAGKMHKGETEITAIKRFVALWTNFAKFGDPTPSTQQELNVIWKPIEGETINYLDIGKDLKLLTDPFPERLNVWKEMQELLARK